MYALDRFFETIFASFAPTLVGILAELFFGNKPAASGIASSRPNGRTPPRWGNFCGDRRMVRNPYVLTRPYGLMVVTSSSATSDAEAVSYSRSDGERCGCRHERRTDGRINARSPGQTRAEMAACNRDADVVASVIDVRQGATTSRDGRAVG